MPINDVLTETEPLVDLDSHGQEIHLQIARFLNIPSIRIVKALHNSFETLPRWQIGTVEEFKLMEGRI